MPELEENLTRDAYDIVADVHRIAVAALVSDGEVLLVHRSSGREAYPDCWDLPGGHIEPGEAPVEAVRRECREELGVEVSDPREVTIPCSDPDLEKRCFVVTQWSGTPTNLAPDEHDGLRWFPVDALPGLAMADLASVPALLAALSSIVGRGVAPIRCQTAPNDSGQPLA